MTFSLVRHILSIDSNNYTYSDKGYNILKTSVQVAKFLPPIHLYNNPIYNNKIYSNNAINQIQVCLCHFMLSTIECILLPGPLSGVREGHLLFYFEIFMLKIFWLLNFHSAPSYYLLICFAHVTEETSVIF